jgi:hypothetical protein
MPCRCAKKAQHVLCLAIVFCDSRPLNMLIFTSMKRLLSLTHDLLGRPAKPLIAHQALRHCSVHPLPIRLYPRSGALRL